MNTTTSLDGSGIVGAALFVVAPLISGLIVLGEFRSTYRLINPSNLAPMILFGMAATSLGLVLLLTGREYRHHVMVLLPED